MGVESCIRERERESFIRKNENQKWVSVLPERERELHQKRKNENRKWVPRKRESENENGFPERERESFIRERESESFIRKERELYKKMRTRV